MRSEQSTTDLTRTRAAAQLIFTACTAVVGVFVVVGLPASRTAVSFWVGAALVGATGPLWFALRDRPGHRAWLLVPVLDLLGVAVMRAELLPDMAALSILLVIPALWLGVERGRVGIVLAGLGGLASFTFPALAGTPVLSTAADVGRLLLQELQTAGLALFGHLAATELRTRGRRLDAELALSRRRELMGRAVVNGVGTGVVVYDDAGRLVSANAEARAIAEAAGYDLDRPGAPGTHVWRQDRTAVPTHEQALVRVLRSEHLPDTLEWVGPPHDLTPVGWNARRMYDDATLLGTVVVCHDLTATFSARRSQEQFLGTVTHELRTPLTSIVGFVDVASSLSPGDDAVLRRSLDAIRRNSERLDERVAQLLDVAEARPEVRLERADLGDLVLAAVDRWRGRCGDLGLHLGGTCDAGVLVDVDPHQLRRVIDALMSNACKFTPPGGDVRVRVAQGGGAGLLLVSDTGIGMSEHDLDRVFDRFQRGDAARVGAVQGMGLGLQTVKRVVEAHAGSVRVASESAVGTTVTVRLPLVGTDD